VKLRVRALKYQWAGIIAVAVALAALPPSWFEHGPPVCLIRAAIGVCPFCGSVRALAHFFHGHLSEAVRMNLNVIVTGPLLLYLAADALVRLAGWDRRVNIWKGSNHRAT